MSIFLHVFKGELHDTAERNTWQCMKRDDLWIKANYFGFRSLNRARNEDIRSEIASSGLVFKTFIFWGDPPYRRVGVFLTGIFLIDS